MDGIERFVPEHRRTNFKNRGAFGADELRRRREEAQIEIRKAKREESLFKRRQTAVPQVDDSDSDDDDIPQSSVSLNLLGQYTNDLLSDDPQRQLSAAIAFRKELCKERNPPIQQVIECGVVPRLVQFLSSTDTMLQFQSAWALTNIASGSHEQTEVVVKSGAIPHFVSLLSSTEAEVQEQAIWALGNIAGDSPSSRNEVLNAGVLPPLLSLIQSSTKISLIRNATWTLSNFCRGKQPAPDWDQIQVVLPALTHLLHYNDDEVLIDACWAVSYLSDGSNQKIQAVIDTGIVRRIVELMGKPNHQLQTPALRSIGNIVTGTDAQTQVVINAGALPKLLQLLGSSKENLRREASWTLSNITAGNPQQNQAVIDNNLIPPLIHLMSTAEFKTKREACWALSNATTSAVKNPEQMQYLVKQGCIKPFVDLINSHDNHVIRVSLDGIENILRVGEIIKEQTGAAENEYAIYIEEAGGLEALNKAQHNSHEEIYRRSFDIITRYFDEGEIDDADGMYAPATNTEGMYSFGTQQPQGEYQF